MKTKLLYWIPTIPVALFMAGGGIADALHVESALAVIRHLGYPDYFLTLIGVAKVLGGVALLAPVPRTLREWAYAGFTFDLLAAAFSHATVGDPIGHVVTPLIGLALVQFSFRAWRYRSAGGDGRSIAPRLQPARA